MAKYKAYPEYKDSGVEWLGTIPDNWYITKLKFVANLLTSKSSNEDELFVGLENISSGDGKYLAKASTLAEGASISFKNNDVLFGKLRPYLAKSWLATFSGVCSSEFLVLRTERLHPRFLNYYLLTKEFIDQVDSSTYGSKMPRASWEFISLLPVPTCPYFLSDKIAFFLDHETAKIDNLIEKQQQLIELLKEKRQAVISHAVTKGLSPDVPMKDSGVEWLGEVPEHWDVKRIKHFGKVVGGFAFKSGDFTDEGYPVIKISNVSHLNFDWTDSSFLPHSFSVTNKEYLAPKGALIFAMTRPVIAGGIKVTLLDNDSAPLVNQRVGFMVVKQEDISRYILISTQSSSFLAQFVNNMTITNQPNISSEGIESIYLPVPPVNELSSILKYLDNLEGSYSDLIDKASRQVSLLQERRTALISAAVTGKIDVRDWDAPNACEAEVSQEVTA